MRTFEVIDAPQRSPEWFAARLGLLTGSRSADMLATLKGGGPAQARKDLAVQLACETLTGQIQEDAYTNVYMQRGIDCEPLAFAAYEARTGAMVQRAGFCRSLLYRAGYSPDGYIGDWEGLVELKCPKSATHLKYLKAQVVPPEHRAQILHALWLTGAQYCDFVSYDDRFPEPLHLFVTRVNRDESAIELYEQQALAFLEEVQLEVDALKTMAGVGPVLQQVLEAR